MMIRHLKLAQLCQFMLFFILVFGFTHLAHASAGKTHVPTNLSSGVNHKIPVIVDTDMGIDDWFALLYLLNRKDVDILAITIPVTGETHCEPGMNNVNKLIDLSGKMANKSIPVACGQAYFSQKYITPFPEKWRREADTLAGLQLPFSSRRPSPLPAETLIQEIIDKQAKLGVKPIIITLGPLTTIANVLDKNPTFKNKIAHVISMGGAVSVKGNIEYGNLPNVKNRVSEWNFFADPLAAKKVIESGVTFKMVPLDATDTVPLSQAFMAQFKQLKKTRSAEFIYGAIHKSYQAENFTGYCFWDSLTVAIVFDESLVSFKNLPIRINYGSTQISGQTVVDHQHGKHIQVALSANSKRFHQDFLDVINR